jgi:hypothetical protein
MIGEHDNRVWISFKVMTPFSECTDDSEQFPIEDLVVSFRWIQGLGQVPTWMILSIIIGLEKHCSGGHEGSISCNCELMSRVGVSKDRLAKETIFQGQERFVTRISP